MASLEGRMSNEVRVSCRKKFQKASERGRRTLLSDYQIPSTPQHRDRRLYQRTERAVNKS